MPPDPNFGPAGKPPGPPGAYLRFEVLSRIAVGSTARVDLAKSLGPQVVGQLIAVKRVLPDLVHDETVGKRFLDEVWMTAALRHPNVVSVVGWGHDNDGPYLAVELVQGVSLARLMKSVFETGEQFPERLVVFVVASVAKGLAAAHELRSERGGLLGLVHRDLSAANVLLSFQGDVKIADFGLAKAKDRLTVTTSELPVRSLAHVSPEELAQRPLDRRADIFSLGVMLYELLTGRNPFQGKDDLDTLENVVRKPPRDPLTLRPKLDRSLAVLVLRCLEKDREKRPPRADDIAAELDQWLYAHGYQKDSVEALGRFVRRNSMRQMRWFERVVAGEPEPAPAPYFAPKPSFYKPAPGAATAPDTMESRGTKPTPTRDVEMTIVERKTKSPAPLPRRSRSTDTFAALGQRSRLRRESTSDASTAPFDAHHATESFDPDVPSLVSTDEDENIPTIAMKVTPQLRQELRERVRGAETPRGPLGTLGLDQVVRTPGIQPIPPPPPVPRVIERRVPPAAAPTGVSKETVSRELDRLRDLASEKHETARLAREAAKAAGIAAESASAEARVVEKAIASARQALDLAAQGKGDEAKGKLEEALAVMDASKPAKGD